MSLERGSRARNLLLGAAFLVLVGGFAAQVRDSLTKFFSGVTTTASSIEVGESDGNGGGRDGGGLKFPVIAACPGFRRGVDWRTARGDLDRWPLNIYFDSHPDGSGTLRKLLLNAPFATFC